VAAIQALHDTGVQVVMLTGDHRATATRIAGGLGIDQLRAEVLPQNQATKVAELQQAGRRVAMVGDGVNDAPRWPRPSWASPSAPAPRWPSRPPTWSCCGPTPLEVPTALRIGRGTLRKLRQNLGWAVGSNAVALPIAAGVFEPAFGLVPRPEIAALSMSGSSLLVAVNALALKQLRLPEVPPPSLRCPPSRPGPACHARRRVRRRRGGRRPPGLRDAQGEARWPPRRP
jgi:P-type Cu2+ transporter